jgi:hypothetical protein
VVVTRNGTKVAKTNTGRLYRVAQYMYSMGSSAVGISFDLEGENKKIIKKFWYGFCFESV